VVASDRRSEVERALMNVLGAHQAAAESWSDTPIETRAGAIDWAARHWTPSGRERAVAMIVKWLTQGPLQWVGYVDGGGGGGG
jgi:hypothetical protein